MPPYLFINICGGFHAKFQVSRTKNKKPTPLFHPKSRLAVYATVWGCGGCGEKGRRNGPKIGTKTQRLLGLKMGLSVHCHTQLHKLIDKVQLIISWNFSFDNHQWDPSGLW